MKLVIAEKPSAAQSYAKALNITAKKSGYFEGKFHHIDLREHGSGNAGTTNVL